MQLALRYTGIVSGAHRRLRGLVMRFYGSAPLAAHAWSPGLRSSKRPATIPPLSSIQGLVPLGTENPREGRHSAADEAPLEVVPAQILPAVFVFNAFGRLFGCIQDHLA